jgi:hypothetical protein
MPAPLFPASKTTVGVAGTGAGGFVSRIVVTRPADGTWESK